MTVDEKVRESVKLGNQVADILLRPFTEALRLVVTRASDPVVAISALGSATAGCFAVAVAYLLARSTLPPSRYPEYAETIVQCFAGNFKDRVNEILLGPREESVLH